MKDQECVPFLQWSLPRLGMRWQGFRKVRGQVCKRIDRRIRELGLEDVAAYRLFLEGHAEEWQVLDSLCRITISRFYRDSRVFRALEREVLISVCEDAVIRGDTELRCWSIGCACGEEPYSLAILWDLGTGPQFPSLHIRIIATDADRNMIERAEQGCYASGSLAGLPEGWISQAFVRTGNRCCIRHEVREKVMFLEQDVRIEEPGGLFHLILCRNLAFTYFDKALQRDVLTRMHDKLMEGGVLVVGAHETLPAGAAGFEPWTGIPGVYLKATNRS